MERGGKLDLRIYEYDPDEIDEVLPFRNAIFGDISHAHWEAMNCTAAVARDGEELVGFIPLQYREQCLRPGLTVPVVYENAVGVAEGRRGQGIGSRMINAAAGFVRDRADALFVIRGSERSEGYRFYRKTGHGDLSYMSFYNLPPEVGWPAAEEAGIEVLDRDRWLDLEPQLLALYEQRYGRFGGGWQRGPGYWHTILDAHVYRDRKWWLIALGTGPERVRGYLVASYGLWDASPDLVVYEVVGEDDAAVASLLRYMRARANSERFRVPYVSLANPVRPLLREMGFEESESSPHIMARILRPDRIFQRLAVGSNLMDTLALTVSTPHRALAVNAPPDPRYTVRLEMKESLLSRLFCCRLDLEVALETEMVRWNGRDLALKRELCDVFSFADWVQWFTDYV
jgi:GNAT superfamily N-acetyltransferase